MWNLCEILTHTTMQDHNMQMHLEWAAQLQVSLAAVAACNSTASSHTSVYSYQQVSQYLWVGPNGYLKSWNDKMIYSRCRPIAASAAVYQKCLQAAYQSLQMSECTALGGPNTQTRVQTQTVAQYASDQWPGSHWITPLFHMCLHTTRHFKATQH